MAALWVSSCFHSSQWGKGEFLASAEELAKKTTRSVKATAPTRERRSISTIAVDQRRTA